MSYLFRKTVPEELPLLQEWNNHPSVHKWIYIDDWEEYYNAVSNIDGYYLYSVYDDNQMIAHIAAETVDNVAALCLIVSPQYHNQGVGTAVLNAMIANTKNLFGNINGYTAHIFSGNTASIKCFTKCSFKLSHSEDEEFVYNLNI